MSAVAVITTRRRSPRCSPAARFGRVAQGAVSVPDFLATVAVAAGLDPSYSLLTPIGRPIAVTDGGRPVAALLAPELTARL